MIPPLLFQEFILLLHFSVSFTFSSCESMHNMKLFNNLWSPYAVCIGFCNHVISVISYAEGRKEGRGMRGIRYWLLEVEIAYT